MFKLEAYGQAYTAIITNTLVFYEAKLKLKI